MFILFGLERLLSQCRCAFRNACLSSKDFFLEATATLVVVTLNVTSLNEEFSFGHVVIVIRCGPSVALVWPCRKTLTNLGLNSKATSLDYRSCSH